MPVIIFTKYYLIPRFQAESCTGIALSDIFSHPELFEIVKPKKKIKLYRYTYRDGARVWQSFWSVDRPDPGRNLIKTETKEI